VLGPIRLLFLIKPHRNIGKLATRGDTELAVNVARMRTDRLDADVKSEGYLGIRAALLEQRKHFSLAPSQQALSYDQRATGAQWNPRSHLKAPRGKVDRVQDVARLSITGKAGARPERKQLDTLGRRWMVSDQDQPGSRMGAAELPHLGQLPQGTDIQDRHVRTVSAQYNTDPVVLDVGRNDREARITLDQLPQSSGEEIVKVGQNDGDGGMWRHKGPSAKKRVHLHRQKPEPG
jgi:hypothetical protein